LQSQKISDEQRRKKEGQKEKEEKEKASFIRC
jgi:hypothetical protein